MGIFNTNAQQKQTFNFGSNLITVGVLSAISGVLALLGIDLVFVGALYTPLFISALGAVIGGETVGIILGIVGLVPAAVFIIMGIMANKYHKNWPHIVGLAIYGLDTVLLIADLILTCSMYDAGEVISSYAMFLIWHALFIFWLSMGLVANIKYVREQKRAALNAKESAASAEQAEEAEQTEEAENVTGSRSRGTGE